MIDNLYDLINEIQDGLHDKILDSAVSDNVNDAMFNFGVMYAVDVSIEIIEEIAYALELGTITNDEIINKFHSLHDLFIARSKMCEDTKMFHVGAASVFMALLMRVRDETKT